MMQNSPQLDHALFRDAPNIIDGLLIVSAVALALLLGWYPFINEWVTIKLIATLVYLGLAHAGYHGRKNLVYGLGLLPLLVILVTVAY